jgi:hypothetical protein
MDCGGIKIRIMTEVNLYLECKEKKLKTYQFEEDVNNIDNARMLLIKYINPFYLSSRYRIIVSNRYLDDGNKYFEISLFFDKNTELNREFLLKELLK